MIREFSVVFGGALVVALLFSFSNKRSTDTVRPERKEIAILNNKEKSYKGAEYSISDYVKVIDADENEALRRFLAENDNGGKYNPNNDS